ncbi:MAG: alpha/beta hydrolase [Chitinophagales bacterium]|nr:alpha/beta hydrolase [Chitinophagales bacterium]
MRFLKILGGLLILLIVINFLGPQPSAPKFSKGLPVVPADAKALEQYIQAGESLHQLKPDNEARIIWANDSLKNQTEYSVVYLHGFTASQEEGNPVHIDFAKKFGCNLFLSRLADHGIDTTNPLANFSADRLWNSAKEAYVIGKKLGKKVILMSTSTGGTLSLMLASEYSDIAALILLSPNIAINDEFAWLLNNHWGLQIAELVKGKHIHGSDTSSLARRYWYQTYSTRSLVQLEELLEDTMKESTFRKVTVPVLLLYYYKDEEHQDPVVKVSAMKRMFAQLGTPDSLKEEAAIPDAESHVIGSFIKSKDVKEVEQKIDSFAEKILHLGPVMDAGEQSFYKRD